MEICRSLNLIYPPFAAAMKEGLVRAACDGLEFRLFETYRSPDRQAELYRQGRTIPGKIVTKAMRWMSWHQYGVAADIALWENGDWSWNFDPAKVAKYFDGLPVSWGGSADGPHYQWHKLPTFKEAQILMVNGCLLDFWNTLEQK